MIFHTPNLALLMISSLCFVAIGWGAVFAARILIDWDIGSGHAVQIRLERQTHLVATAMKFVFILLLTSLILFVLNADRMAVLFTGAMCAVGTLQVNGYGLWSLGLQILLFFGGAVWLLMHSTDMHFADYPLTRQKYTLLLGLAPLTLSSALVQFLYFFNLETDVITSCCSMLFTPEAVGLGSSLSAIRPDWALGMLYSWLALLAISALSIRKNHTFLMVIYALCSIIGFVVGIMAITSVISPYIYEQPHHHCPFCILKSEYGYVGYVLYLPLFAATAWGLSAGGLAVSGRRQSQVDGILKIAKRHVALSLSHFALFGAIGLFLIARSNLILFG